MAKFGCLMFFKILVGLLYLRTTNAKISHVCDGQTKAFFCQEDQYVHIKQAIYGREERGCSISQSWYSCGSDVLDKARTTCGEKKSVCAIQASAQNFRNGCNFGPQFLYLEHECRDRPNAIKTRRYCDRYGGFYGCPQGKLINIVSAFYGRKSTAYCQNGDTSNTNCVADATKYAKHYGQGKNIGIASASSALFGDPCPGISKYLEINFQCLDRIPTTRKPSVPTTVQTTKKPTTRQRRQTTNSPARRKTKRICDGFAGRFGCRNGKQIDIVKAFYGRKSAAYCQNGDTSNTRCSTDVTRTIKSYTQGKYQAYASANAASFGDPCPGISKYLEITYQCVYKIATTTKKTTQPTTAPLPTTRSSIRTRRYCDRYGGFYGCPQGKLINIVSAFYGRKSTAYCQNGDTSNTNCVADATKYAKHYGQGKNIGIASASSALFGDPCPGISKYLEINFQCLDRAAFSTTKAPTTKPPFPTGFTKPKPPPIPPGSCGISQVAQSRIIGGTDATPGAWPWQVALYRKNDFACGGSLISPEWIVTATHCVENMKTGDVKGDYYVILGDQDRSINEGTEVRRMLTKIVLHPDYNKVYTYNNDIALLKMDRPVMFSMRVSPICLPPQGQKVPVNTRCYLSGWGMTSFPSNPSNILQQGSLPIVSKQECARRLNASIQTERLTISDQMLCAGNSASSSDGNLNACRGDSGGPLVCQESNGKWTLRGAVSWGSIRCSGLDRYSVFARVSEFRSWIDEVMKSNGIPPPPPPSPWTPPPQPPAS